MGQHNTDIERLRENIEGAITANEKTTNGLRDEVKGLLQVLQNEQSTNYTSLVENTKQLKIEIDSCNGGMKSFSENYEQLSTRVMDLLSKQEKSEDDVEGELSDLKLKLNDVNSKLTSLVDENKNHAAEL